MRLGCKRKGPDLVGPAPGGDIRLVAQDGVDPGRGGLAVELHRAVEVAVIGDGNGRHPVTLHMLDEFRHAGRAVEQGVMGVAMQVCEWSAHHSKKYVCREG